MWTSTEKNRLAAIMYVRGFVVLALGAIGLRWPQSTLEMVIVMAGAIVTLLGVAEMLVASRSHADKPVKSLLLYVAAVSIAFGAVSLAVSFAMPKTAVAALAVWLVANATVSLMVAAVMSRANDRRVLLGWSAINLLAALVAAALSASAFYGLLYAGAAYAASYGVLQIGAGLRLRADAIGFRTRAA